MQHSNELISLNETEKKLPFNARKTKNFVELDFISLSSDYEAVGMGECLETKENDPIMVITYGANPCISGMIETKDSKLVIFHSYADTLSDDQKKLFSESKRGIVGGGKKSLETLSEQLAAANITTIPSPGIEYDFNLVLIKPKNEFDIKPGLYYCYDNLLEDLEA